MLNRLPVFLGKSPCFPELRELLGFARFPPVLSDHRAQAGPSDASYRVAEGGLEFVELYRSIRFAHTLQQLRQSYRVIGTAAETGQPIDALHRAGRPFALVIGNEEHGLPRATLEACDEIVTIPGSGFVQSLNVAASAAILLHILARRSEALPQN